ncbi:MAG TPA: hypothetical protein VGN17_00395 [Bryobacteraceae bacterium]|jgi:hypothetical protein
MADTLGPIQTPTPKDSGLTFPFVSDFGYSTQSPYTTVTHRFGELATKATQTFLSGIGPTKYFFKRSVLSEHDAAVLLDFYESVQGSFQSFIYNAPTGDHTTTPVQVVFDVQPVSIQHLATMCQIGLTFIEAPSSSTLAPYDIVATVTRFPSDTLNTALLSQVQQIIPLVHIKVLDSTVPDIYLSDRRVTVGGNSYLPRLLDIGEPGTSVIMSQNISGAADNVQFTFGNADRSMVKLANATELKNASIDLCLYHVQTGILIQLWKGFVVSYQSDGTSTFTLQCSDGLFRVTQPYPTRTVSRTCYKPFNSSPLCPYGSAGSGGNPNACSYQYDDAVGSGCVQHGMQAYFGGIRILQEGVQILDNSSGFLGFDRNRVTSTSIVSDSIWGQCLPEIWCNDDGDAGNAFYANCLVAAVRDEGDYFDVLGIVGVGRIGQYTGMQVHTNSDGYHYIISPLADGQLPQGFKVNSQLVVTSDTSLGLRELHGEDPDTVDDFSLTSSGNVQTSNKAAGLAFVDLRYAKPSGINPSTTDSHSMVVPISQGLAGWVWDASGTRSSVSGLTNPFWIAVNVYLRALGLQTADSATQLQYFVLDSLIFGDGSGCAEIADLVVDDLLGIGTEKQFRFMGSFAQQKPVRDWLTEIMNCCNGYFTFEFGKLKLGIRENAGSVSAFTGGNTLYQSLHLAPIDTQFERLEISFADKSVQYQANTATYEDRDHEIYYGRLAAPLVKQMHSVGISSLSQALRVAATLVREETGGINASNTFNNGTDIDPVEWRTARKAAWGTTILALETEVGQVVSMTHPDIPGKSGTVTVSGVNVTLTGGDSFTQYTGDTSLVNKEVVINGVQVTITAVTDGSHLMVDTSPGNGTGLAYGVASADFRITKWTLMKDWSIQIEGRTVTDSMYQLDIGPKPVDIAPLPLPVMFYPEPLGCWAPFQVQAPSSDALWPHEWTFDAQQIYNINADGSASAYIVTQGKEPANEFIPNVGAPSITAGNVVRSTTGGSLEGGKTYRVAICGRNSDAVCTPPSEVILVQIPSGTNTNKFVVNGIIWPSVSGLVDFAVFVSEFDDLLCEQSIVSLTGSGGSISPTTFTVTGPLARSTWALPNPNSQKIRIKPKILTHGGILGAGVTSVSDTTLISADCVDVTLSDDYTGRQLVIIGREEGSAPFESFNITDFDPSTGTFTLDRSASAVMATDAFVVTFAGYDNSGSPRTFTDSLISNSLNFNPVTRAPTPHSGLTTNQDKGCIARVIAGTNRGAKAKIVSNGSTTYNFDVDLVLDSTSVIIIEDGAWGPSADSSDIATTQSQLATSISAPTANFLKQSLLVGGYTVDTNGIESDDINAPVRMIYIYGTSANLPKPQLTLVFSGQGGNPDLLLNDTTTIGIINSSGVLTSWQAVAQEPPEGQAIYIDILRSTDQGATYTTIFTGAGAGGGVLIPDGLTTLQTGTAFSGTINVTAGDLFYAKVLQIGTSQAGGRVNINLYLKSTNTTNIIAP